MLKFKPDLLIFMTHDLILYSFMFNQAHSHGGGGQGTKGSLALRISLATQSFFF